jgi:hypothetical protein
MYILLIGTVIAGVVHVSLIETYHTLTRFDMQMCCYWLFLIHSTRETDTLCKEKLEMCEAVGKGSHRADHFKCLLLQSAKVESRKEFNAVYNPLSLSIQYSTC